MARTVKAPANGDITGRVAPGRLFWLIQVQSLADSSGLLVDAGIGHWRGQWQA
jgi:hypothetical protein